MPTLVTIGLELAKNIFQVHGLTAEGRFWFADKWVVARVIAHGAG